MARRLHQELGRRRAVMQFMARMKVIGGGVLANPFVWAITLVPVFYFAEKGPKLIPGPFRANADASLEDQLLAATNRMAAFEALVVGLYFIIAAQALYNLFTHRTDSFKWVAAKIVILLLFVLSVWTLANRVTCKLMSNATAMRQWGENPPRGLCESVNMSGTVTVLAITGFLAAGWILWNYLTVQKTSKK